MRFIIYAIIGAFFGFIYHYTSCNIEETLLKVIIAVTNVLSMLFVEFFIYLFIFGGIELYIK